jgi:serine/threonine protein kinase
LTYAQANIFIGKHGRLKIGDLGVAKVLDETGAFADSLVGTPYYLSPELCENKPYNCQSDVWALGVILYELCTFERPFTASNQAALVMNILRGKYKPVSTEYSHDLRLVLKDMLARNPTKRLTLDKLFRLKCVHDWAEKVDVQIPVTNATRTAKKTVLAATAQGSGDNCSPTKLGRASTPSFRRNRSAEHTARLGGNVRGTRVRGKSDRRVLAPSLTHARNQQLGASPPHKIRQEEVSVTKNENDATLPPPPPAMPKKLPEVFRHKRSSRAPAATRPTVQQLRALMMATSLERRSTQDTDDDEDDKDDGAKIAELVECDQQLVTSGDVLIYGFYDAEGNGDHPQMPGSEVEEEGKSRHEGDANNPPIEDMDGEHPLSSTLPSTSVLTY